MEDVIESLSERIAGRAALEDVVHPATGELLVPANEMITDCQAQVIEEAGIEKVKIRSVLRCRTVMASASNATAATWQQARWWMWVKLWGLLLPSPLANPVHS